MAKLKGHCCSGDVEQISHAHLWQLDQAFERKLAAAIAASEKRVVAQLMPRREEPDVGLRERADSSQTEPPRSKPEDCDATLRWVRHEVDSCLNEAVAGLQAQVKELRRELTAAFEARVTAVMSRLDGLGEEVRASVALMNRTHTQRHVGLQEVLPHLEQIITRVPHRTDTPMAESLHGLLPPATGPAVGLEEALADVPTSAAARLAVLQSPLSRQDVSAPFVSSSASFTDVSPGVGRQVWINASSQAREEVDLATPSSQDIEDQGCWWRGESAALKADRVAQAHKPHVDASAWLKAQVPHGKGAATQRAD